MDEARYLAGRLLLALPGIGDPVFEHAAIALCMHDANGAFGLNLGATIAGLNLRDLLADIGIDPGEALDLPVHQGGPIEPGRGFVLHSTDWGGSETMLVNPYGALSASLDVLRAIAEGRGPSRFVVALGFSGWGAGQIEGELGRHGWFVAPADPDIIYDIPANRRWAASWKAEGIDPALLSSVSGRA